RAANRRQVAATCEVRQIIDLAWLRQPGRYSTTGASDEVNELSRPGTPTAQRALRDTPPRGNCRATDLCRPGSYCSAREPLGKVSVGRDRALTGGSHVLSITCFSSASSRFGRIKSRNANVT